jgi:hypothetical protein
MAAQLTLTSGPCLRAERQWMKFARTSFPVPAVFLVFSAVGERAGAGKKFFFRTNVLTSGHSPSNCDAHFASFDAQNTTA